MSAKDSKKTGGFFQKLFGSGPTPKRKAKEVKKSAPKKPDLPPPANLLPIETTDETELDPNETPLASKKTVQCKIGPQVTGRVAVKSGTQGSLFGGKLATPTVRSSTQAGTVIKSSTSMGTVAKHTTTQIGGAVKGSTQLGPAVKGQARAGPESSRRNASGKSGAASGSGTRPGKTASSGARSSRHPRTSGTKRSQRRRKKKPPAPVKVDTSRPIEYPTTPEMILAYHKAKPLLNKTEEWVVVSLNEYECMVDSLDVIRTMGKHSQFFEVEPEELCEEFFEYVEDVPAYDEVINADIWQEFRYAKYNW